MNKGNENQTIEKIDFQRIFDVFGSHILQRFLSKKDVREQYQIKMDSQNIIMVSKNKELQIRNCGDFILVSVCRRFFENDRPSREFGVTMVIYI